MTHVVEQFENSWLSRYLRRNRCVHDNGKESVDSDFVRLLAQTEITDVYKEVRNPQLNVIYERMHQAIRDILHVVLHINRLN